MSMSPTSSRSWFEPTTIRGDSGPAVARLTHRITIRGDSGHRAGVIAHVFCGEGPMPLWGARLPLGGHVLQRASVYGGLKPYVSSLSVG